jgi:hypothetical protein
MSEELTYAAVIMVVLGIAVWSIVAWGSDDDE